METEIPNEIFSQQSKILVDNSIERIKYKTFIPQSKADINTGGHVTEIDIPAADAYYVPAKSFLKIKGKLVKVDDAAYNANDQIALINNAIMYLFSNIEYSLGGQVIETLHDPGQTTSMLGYLSYPDDFNTSAGLTQCWRKDENVGAIATKYMASPQVAAGAAIPAERFTPQENPNYNAGFAIRRKLLLDNDTPGNFSFNIPFSHMFGFAEYNKILYNLQHTLKFTRGSDTLAILRPNNVAAGKIELTDIRWVVPKITPAVEMRTTLLESVKNKTNVLINFSGRSDHHATVTANADTFEWTINKSSGIEKPRWIIVGFQTDKHRTQEQNPAVFDHLGVTNASVELNDEKYPAYDTTVNFASNDYVDFCQMTDEFKREHYEFNNLIGGTQIDMINYKKLFPLLVFDVRHQSELVRSNVMGMKFSFKFSANVPERTNMHVIIISDRVLKLTSDGQTPVIEKY